jgi:hypothetical protein
MVNTITRAVPVHTKQGASERELEPSDEELVKVRVGDLVAPKHKTSYVGGPERM